MQTEPGIHHTHLSVEKLKGRKGGGGRSTLQMLNKASGHQQMLYLAHGADSSMAGYVSASKQQPVLLVVDSVKFNLTH